MDFASDVQPNLFSVYSPRFYPSRLQCSITCHCKTARCTEGMHTVCLLITRPLSPHPTVLEKPIPAIEGRVYLLSHLTFTHLLPNVAVLSYLQSRSLTCPSYCQIDSETHTNHWKSSISIVPCHLHFLATRVGHSSLLSLSILSHAPAIVPHSGVFRPFTQWRQSVSHAVIEAAALPDTQGTTFSRQE